MNVKVTPHTSELGKGQEPPRTFEVEDAEWRPAGWDSFDLYYRINGTWVRAGLLVPA